MEAQTFRCLQRIVTALPHPRPAGVSYADQFIVLVFFWAALHDRPVYWACDVRNWPTKWAIDRLPDDSTMSRRLRTLSVLQLLQRLHDAIGSLFAVALLIKHVDSFPLPVGNYSKDHEARRGRAAGTMARGYKLHVICVDGAIAPWTVRAMNTNDQVPAPELFAQLQGGGYITADNGYDANPLHLAAAAANHQLLAPPRPSDRQVKCAGLQRRRNCRQRLQALDMLNCPLRHAGVGGDRFGAQLHRQRVMVEQTLGHLRMLLLGGLPPWVRRPRRVARWMAAKLIILNLRTAMARRRIK